MHACNVIADIAIPLKNHGVYFVFLFLNRRTKQNSNLQRNIHVTAEHVFITSGYLYAATAYKFRVHFALVGSNIVSVHKIPYYKFYPKIELPV